MRTWARARRRLRCGRCGAEIRTGDVMLALTVSTISEPKIRCASLECAGEAAPKDLPANVVSVPMTPLTMTRFSTGMLPLDFKRALVTREPGEEG